MQPNQTSSSIIYGTHAVEELLAAGAERIDHVYFSGNRRSRTLFALMKRCRSMRINYSHAPEARLQELTNTSKHQGVVAQCSVKPYASIEEIESLIAASTQPALVMVPSSVEDPRNLGSIIRSCVAFGVHAIVLERKHTASLSSAAAKAAAGMIERATISRPRNLENAVASWRQRGWMILGADPTGTFDPAHVDFKQPCAIIMGGEHRGIPPYLFKHCTHIVRIPMPGPVSSLNVSVAAAILLYECSRQRSSPEAHPPLEASPLH